MGKSKEVNTYLYEKIIKELINHEDTDLSNPDIPRMLQYFKDLTKRRDLPLLYEIYQYTTSHNDDRLKERAAILLCNCIKSPHILYPDIDFTDFIINDLMYYHYINPKVHGKMLRALFSTVRRITNPHNQSINKYLNNIGDVIYYTVDMIIGNEDNEDNEDRNRYKDNLYLHIYEGLSYMVHQLNVPIDFKRMLELVGSTCFNSKWHVKLFQFLLDHGGKPFLSILKEETGKYRSFFSKVKKSVKGDKEYRKKCHKYIEKAWKMADDVSKNIKKHEKKFLGCTSYITTNSDFGSEWISEKIAKHGKEKAIQILKSQSIITTKDMISGTGESLIKMLKKNCIDIEETRVVDVVKE